MSNTSEAREDALRALSELKQRTRRVEFDVLKLRYEALRNDPFFSNNSQGQAAIWESYRCLTDLANRFFDGEPLIDDECA